MAELYEKKIKLILNENEVSANIFVSRCLLLMVGVLVALCASGLLGLVRLSSESFMISLLVVCPVLLLNVLLCRIFKGEGAWIRDVMMFSVVFTSALVDYAFTFQASPMILFPVVISCHYFSRTITVRTAVATALVFAVSCIFGAVSGIRDMNFVMPAAESFTVAFGEDAYRYMIGEVDLRATIINTLHYGYFFRLVQLCLFTPVLVYITRRVSTLTGRQAELTGEHTRTETELELASGIQNAVIPVIDDNFPNRPEIDVFGTMDAAKQVGGDFYDVFFIDDDHLALVIADVSGKGVPAALLMMVAKALVKSTVTPRRSPADVLARVNNVLCARNPESMFITAWMGFLTLSTGELVCANAGHEYPVVRRADGEFAYLRDRHGLVLGEFENMRYTDYTLTLAPGDSIFVYTDGVPEANSAQKELYGKDRLLGYLNENARDLSTKDTVRGVRADVDAFAGAEPQFDDITMLYVRYLGTPTGSRSFELELEAAGERVSEVIDFAENVLGELGCSIKTIHQFDIVIDELFSNVAKYAYPDGKGTVQVRIETRENPSRVMIRFSDSGTPYNPLAKEDPDVTRPISEREPGGLGVLMVKKLMDDVRYEYENGCNVLTATKLTAQ